MAGKGKYAIAHTIANRSNEAVCMGAYFCFDARRIYSPQSLATWLIAILSFVEHWRVQLTTIRMLGSRITAQALQPSQSTHSMFLAQLYLRSFLRLLPS
ncbi:hypothetical protein M405DRAFT_383246 [Rhizopogon salebrosus TDB-379]|nr:hypothetical protein M405DRAFT_383246 [Rhizopogon salebrosus TDB-379]